MRVSFPLAALGATAVTAFTIKESKTAVLPGAYIVEFHPDHVSRVN